MARQVRPADIVRDGGTAGRAEDLIDAVYGARPPALVKAINLIHFARAHAARAAENPHYEPPETPVLDLGEVEEAAGLYDDDDTHVVAAALHGSVDGAWVVYVAQDAVGSHYKGAYPYADHGDGEVSEDHVSEAEAFAESTVGQRLAQEADGEDEALSSTKRKRRPPSSDEEEEDEDGAEPDFDIAALNIDEVAERIDDAPEDEREHVKAELRAAEEARGQKARKGVLEATEPENGEAPEASAEGDGGSDGE